MVMLRGSVGMRDLRVDFLEGVWGVGVVVAVAGVVWDGVVVEGVLARASRTARWDGVFVVMLSVALSVAKSEKRGRLDVAGGVGGRLVTAVDGVEVSLPAPFLRFCGTLPSVLMGPFLTFSFILLVMGEDGDVDVNRCENIAVVLISKGTGDGGVLLHKRAEEIVSWKAWRRKSSQVTHLPLHSRRPSFCFEHMNVNYSVIPVN